MENLSEVCFVRSYAARFAIKGKEMLVRSLGAVIVAFALVILGASVYGLHGMSTAIRLSSETAPAWRHDVDLVTWKAHFQAYWAMWLVAAIIAAIGGVLLLMKRTVGLTLFTVAPGIVLIYPFVVRVVIGTAYRFEALNYANAAAALSLLCLAVVARVALLRAVPVGR